MTNQRLQSLQSYKKQPRESMHPEEHIILELIEELEKLNDVLNSTLCKLKDIKESLLDYTIDEWSTPYINMGIIIKNIEALEKSKKEKQLDSINEQAEYPDYSSMLHLSLHLSENHICKRL